MSDEQWYWCLEHKTVEVREGCRSADRLGPYTNAAEAARALERSDERNEAYDTDPRWNDDTDEDGDIDEDDKQGWGPFKH
ncbi:hypothetical protein [Aestuariimicrobium ganziense]|uniref:hypothetical protein n=1 Tax=Aestuariimicrobium ganziense TaxID=2773677 RepID=UPI00194453CF|nr:hypothetical protein [Aestuariimicrobium ganziense]